MVRSLSLFCLICLVPATAPAAEPVSHRVLTADQTHGKLAIVEKDGSLSWEYPIRNHIHSLWMLPNGNILTHISDTTVVEINPKKEIVWKYESKPKPGYTGRVEVHAIQRLPDGNTMIAECGNTRIIEVTPEGKIAKVIPLKVAKSNPHRDTRMVSKLDSGNYLVCQEMDGCVREYDATGKIVWEYKLDLGGRPAAPGHGVEGHGVEVFGAKRLKNGNTLIGGGNNNRVLEVDPKGTIVWSIDQKELPGITLAWVTTLTVLPNGNLVFGNCHAGPMNPQIIEVTREKKVVWAFKDFKNFGNSLVTSVILDAK